MTQSPPSEQPLPQPVQRTPPMQAPATRREVLLFGILILALIWTTVGMKPRTVVVIPDSPVRAGVIT